MKLYEIREEYVNIFNELFENGEDENVIKDTLSSLEDDFKDKALNVSAYIKNLEADVKAMKEYEASMREKRQAAENKICRLKDYLVSNMQEMKIDKISGVELSIRLGKATQSVVIDNGDYIHERYISSVIKNFDKAAIKEDIKFGIHISGAHLEDGKSFVVIK